MCCNWCSSDFDERMPSVLLTVLVCFFAAADVGEGALHSPSRTKGYTEVIRDAISSAEGEVCNNTRKEAIWISRSVSAFSRFRDTLMTVFQLDPNCQFLIQKLVIVKGLDRTHWYAIGSNCMSVYSLLFHNWRQAESLAFKCMMLVSIIPTSLIR